jgi:hypothetical protein
MEQSEQTWTCYRCTMRFDIADADGRNPERLRCPECSLPFWSGMQNNGLVRVGVSPSCRMIQTEETGA